MRYFKTLMIFFTQEWLMSLSLFGIIITSFMLQTIPSYSTTQLIPIFLLWMLFMSVKGLELSGLLSFIALQLEKGRLLAPKLVIISFMLSVILSIDVTLVTLLPLVLSMHIKKRNALVLLVAFTAHAGASLTPFGTPQNLFIFSFYNLDVFPFIHTIAPFSIGLFTLFLIISFFISTAHEKNIIPREITVDTQQGILYLLLLTLVVLAVLRICPWYTALITLVTALLFNHKILKVDYPLLITFILFLGLANELKTVLEHYLEHPVHLFILSSLLSQFISNVPTTLLLHQFTPKWEALLWGTNVGGFGTLIAALANLITYRIYASYESKKASRLFLAQMTFWGFIVYLIGTGLYLLVSLDIL